MVARCCPPLPPPFSPPASPGSISCDPYAKNTPYRTPFMSWPIRLLRTSGRKLQNFKSQSPGLIKLRSEAASKPSLMLFRPSHMSLCTPSAIWTSCYNAPYETKKATVQARMAIAPHLLLRRHFWSLGLPSQTLRQQPSTVSSACPSPCLSP